MILALWFHSPGRARGWKKIWWKPWTLIPGLSFSPLTSAIPWWPQPKLQAWTLGSKVFIQRFQRSKVFSLRNRNPNTPSTFYSIAQTNACSIAGARRQPNMLPALRLNRGTRCRIDIYWHLWRTLHNKTKTNATFVAEKRKAKSTKDTKVSGCESSNNPAAKGNCPAHLDATWWRHTAWSIWIWDLHDLWSRGWNHRWGLTSLQSPELNDLVAKSPWISCGTRKVLPAAYAAFSVMPAIARPEWSNKILSVETWLTCKIPWRWNMKIGPS